MVCPADIPSPLFREHSSAGLFIAVGLVIVVSALVLFVMRKKKRK